MPSKRVAQFDLSFVPESMERARSWLSQAMKHHVFGEDYRLALHGTEFDLEWSFTPNAQVVNKCIEVDILLKAIWLVAPRSRGMIADDDVDTLWRFSGFPLSISS